MARLSENPNLNYRKIKISCDGPPAFRRVGEQVLRLACAELRSKLSRSKTAGSRKHLSIDGSLLDVLKAWKQTTQFSAPGDRVFASSTRLGHLPWSECATPTDRGLTLWERQ